VILEPAAVNHAVLVVPAEGKRAGGSLAAEGDTLYAGTHDGVFRLNGDTWTRVDTGISDTAITALACAAGAVYVGTRGGGVFRSVDAGQTWGRLGGN
ncbi:MAG: hypothetical protein ABGY41_19545, partial [Candidatus Poribacteria bacterium]